MEIFAIWPAALFVVAVLFGLLVGSFLNVVAYRLPLMMEREWRAQCAQMAERRAVIEKHPRGIREHVQFFRQDECHESATVPEAAWR